MSAKTRILSVFLLVFLALGAWRTLRTCRAVSAAEEQALIATIKLRTGDMGSSDERKRIIALEDQLSDAIEHAAAGQFDGDEYGGGVCTIYMYGPSAERLFTVTIPILKKFRAPAGSYVIKRYGKPGAKQDRVELGGD
ncbi:MAG TPA: hypothetical protein VEV41_21660 [Terriglobales bacterium]|nr:hypothetical protein [Terriglobales bacterium]